MSGSQIQNDVDSMLAKYDILSYRNLFAQPQYSKQNMPKDIDRLIKPYVLSDEERKIKTGILTFYIIAYHIESCHSDMVKISQSNIHVPITTLQPGSIPINVQLQ